MCASLSVGGLLAAGWLVQEDERPAWLPLDGRTLNVAAYPELFKATGVAAGGTTFQLPDEPPELQANDIFGVQSVRRCVATRELADKTPAGTIAICGRP